LHNSFNLHKLAFSVETMTINDSGGHTPTQAHKPAFACQMCGQCCVGQGGIVVTNKDQERLSEWLGMSLVSFQEAYTEDHGDVRVLKSSGRDQACIFFQAGTGCSVHSHKPALCRAWPFFRGNLIDETSFHMAKDGCPGISHDVDHQEFVRQGLLYLQEHGLIHENEPDAPRALVIKKFPG